MKHVIAVLFAATTLAGCGTVADMLVKTGQVLMDPSIQVGSDEDQPTYVALSLYASRDVNPNPVSLPSAPLDEDAQADAPALEDGPMAVSLRGVSQGELIEHLVTLLRHLQQDSADSPNPFAVNQAVSAAHPRVDEPRPAVAVGATASDALLSGNARSRGPFPVTWMLRHGGTQPDADAAASAQPMLTLDLGQYGQGAGLPLAAGQRDAPAAATPIALRILQLKDDSLLEHADPALLRKDPKSALGSSFLASDDYILAPGQFKFIEFTVVDEKARYIAVVADFHDPSAERGHDVFRIESRGRKYPLMVIAKKTRVAIMDERHRAAQSNGYPGHSARSD